MHVSWTSLGMELPILNHYEFYQALGGTGLSVPPSTKVKCTTDQFERFHSVQLVQLHIKPRTKPHYKRFTVRFRFCLTGSVQFGSPVQNQTLTSLFQMSASLIR